MAPKELSPRGPSPGPGPAGKDGEDRACDFLRRLGFQIIDRNFRCRVGEIDIVARDGDAVVFVEVKERQDTSRGAAVESVTRAKRRRIVRAAELWAAAHGTTEGRMRFDVVAIDRGAGTGRAQVRHERGAFDADGD